MAFGLTGIGPGEWFVLLAAILVLFGSKRLPEVTRQIGRTLAELRRASNEFRDQIMMADYDADNPPIDMDPSTYEEMSYEDEPTYTDDEVTRDESEPGKGETSSESTDDVAADGEDGESPRDR